MVNYYVRRTARVFATVFAVMTVTFGLIRLLPGGSIHAAARAVAPIRVPAEQVNQQIENLQNIRPDAPLWEQYINYMISVVQPDLGQSISKGDPVVGSSPRLHRGRSSSSSSRLS